MWRPEGWENPYPDSNYGRVKLKDYHRTYEAGASAILDALKSQFDSEHLEAYQTHNMCNHVAGTWVFIPDDEVKS